MRTGWILCALACASSMDAAPALTYSTYLRQGFTPNATATDSAGNVYVAGAIAVDAVARETTGLVLKLNPQGTVILYERYLGGATYDAIKAIAVDAAGDAYVVGQTGSPDFPVTPGSSLGTAATGQTDPRSFAAKLDPTGNLVYSTLLGGSTLSAAQAVAIAAGGQAVVSGMSSKAGFPSTSGAYQVADTTQQPYLLELDPTGTKLAWAATGIGGSSLAIDSSGNIYMSGTTTRQDYPTTPGVYQTTFPLFYECLGLCQLSFPGANQYLSKVNSTGSKLIYSTAVGGAFPTDNGGLAVDPSGNAYLTGYTTPGYVYTVTAPPSPPTALPGNPVFAGLPFLTKLDPLGQKVLFSIPLGGTEVQLDSSGRLYVGGRIGTAPGITGSYLVGAPAALTGVPAPCLPNSVTITNSSYVAQVDGTQGNVLATQFLEGSNMALNAIALNGSTLWMAGASGGPDVPLTTHALTPDFTVPNYGLGLGTGGYVGAVDFGQPQPAAGTPQIGCVLDGGAYSPAGPSARYQLLTIFGSNLGPATGVAATDNSTLTLGGVAINFDATPAILLYASSTQIDLAVPLLPTIQGSAAMQIQVNGVYSAARQIALTYANPHMFLYAAPDGLATTYLPIALNANGTQNTSTNRALAGTTVSLFVNGLASNPQLIGAPPQLLAAAPWQVTKVSQITPFVVRVDVQYTNSCPAQVCGTELQLFTPYGLSVYPQYLTVYLGLSL